MHRMMGEWHGGWDVMRCVVLGVMYGMREGWHGYETSWHDRMGWMGCDMV